jgi:hypothetical protein
MLPGNSAQLIDMSVLEFYSMSSTLNADDLMVLHKMIEIARIDIRYYVFTYETKMGNLKVNGSLPINEETNHLLQSIVSLAAKELILNEKLEICKHFEYEKTPDCFKNGDLVQ